jgi:hypothetical protein
MAKKKTGSAAPAKVAKATKAARVKWFDAKSHAPLIETYTRRLDSFLQTMADGIVEDRELEQQEERLIGLMKEVEPLLDDAQHAKVTQLLCELTAYDIMQMVNGLQKARPKTTFRG